MKSFIRLLLILALFQLPAFFCYVEQSTVSIKVVSTAQGFDGYYIADGGTIAPFEVTVATSGNLFIYEASIPAKTSVRVHATCAVGGSSIQILIYKSSSLVKSAEATDENSGTPSVTLDYAFEESSS